MSAVRPVRRPIALRPVLARLEDRCTPTTFVVTNLLDGPVSKAGALPGSLRQAIFDANANPGADVVDATGVSGVIGLVAGELYVNNSVSIIGPGASDLSVDAKQKSRVIEINTTGNYEPAPVYAISDITIRGGKTSSSGGGIDCYYTGGKLTLSRVNITGNEVYSYGVGGGLAVHRADVLIEHSTISNNTSGMGAGGGVYLDGAFGISTLIDTEIRNNATSSPDGGAGLSTRANTSLSNCLVADNISLAGGPGGGIYADGTLTLLESDVVRNMVTGTGTFRGDGGGVYSRSTATVMRCTIAANTVTNGNGGGVYCGGYFAVQESAVVSNLASSDYSGYGNGGGIYAQSSVKSFRGSTISDNTASGMGGGFFVVSSSSGSPMTLRNCTLTANQARDGGGIATNWDSDFIVLDSTIVADNIGLQSADDVLTPGTLQAVDSNMGTLAGVSTLIRSGTLLIGSPDLGPLADNGGPTATHLPSPLSLVRNAGRNPDSLSNDQRGTGFPRLIGGGVDIGAVESFDPAPTAVVQVVDVFDSGPATFDFIIRFDAAISLDMASIVGNNEVVRVSGPNGFDASASFLTIDDATPGATREVTYRMTTPGGTWDPADNGTYAVIVQAGKVFDSLGVAVLPGQRNSFRVFIPSLFVVTNVTDGPVTKAGDLPGSLRQAIFDANAVKTVDTITFDPGVFSTPQTISLVAGQLKIAGDTTVVGPGSQLLTLDGQLASGVLWLIGAIEFSGFTITNGMTPYGRGAGIEGSGKLTLKDCVIAGNTVAGGNGFYLGGGGATLGGTVNMENCIITNNVALIGDGGGIAMWGYNSLTMRHCIIAGNSTVGSGGGLFFVPSSGSWWSGDVLIENSLISGNYAAASGSAPNLGGGGVYFHGSMVDTTPSHRATLTVRRSSIVSNSTSKVGGGISVQRDDQLVLQSSTIQGNLAGSSGAGIGLWDRGGFLIEDSTISDNYSSGEPSSFVSSGGGGLYFWGAPSPLGLTVRNSTISGNSTAAAGGGIVLMNAGGSLNVQNSTITNNTSSLAGGGIARVNGGAVIQLTSSIVAANFHPATPDISTTGKVTADRSLIGATDGIADLAASASIRGSLEAPVDPQLGPLADNGGTTRTHALLPGSPAIDAGSNPLNLAADQRGVGFGRAANGAADVGAYEVQTPPRVIGVTVNYGALQRSRVTTVTVSFDRAVTLPINPASAFHLQRQSDNAVVILQAAQTGNTVDLTFIGGAVEGSSLADGRYTLTLFAAQVSGGNFDGNGDGTPGDNYSLSSAAAPNAPTNIWRLFGDYDADNDVDAIDFAYFRMALMLNTAAFDFDNDGDVDTSDYAQFRTRFGSSV